MATVVGGAKAGDRVNVMIRPERIRLDGSGGALDTLYLGDHQKLLVRLGNGQILTVKTGSEAAYATGEKLTLAWSIADCRAFPAESPNDANSGRSP
jgi:putative spermidine/putrescine transport system ATP-binding protein